MDFMRFTLETKDWRLLDKSEQQFIKQEIETFRFTGDSLTSVQWVTLSTILKKLIKLTGKNYSCYRSAAGIWFSVKHKTLLVLIEEWEEVVQNLHEFQKVRRGDGTTLYSTLGKFYHWYYFPQNDAFAPSKFLGYKSRIYTEYSRDGDGRETEPALEPFFYKLEKNTEQFKRLYQRLEQFIIGQGKTIDDKVLNGSGGIHVPKQR
jgi:hypothetical protein